MKIISVHNWKIFVQIVCKSVDFMSKPFKKQDEIQDSQLQIILNKGRPRLTIKILWCTFPRYRYMHTSCKRF